MLLVSSLPLPYGPCRMAIGPLPPLNHFTCDYVSSWSCKDISRLFLYFAIIGDVDHKPFVSTDCDCRQIELGCDDDLLILGCDGLFDTLDPNKIAKVRK